jgi:hypothetical protein
MNPFVKSRCAVVAAVVIAVAAVAPKAEASIWSAFRNLWGSPLMEAAAKPAASHKCCKCAEMSPLNCAAIKNHKPGGT